MGGARYRRTDSVRRKVALDCGWSYFEVAASRLIMGISGQAYIY
jgi:hypothetical protein